MRVFEEQTLTEISVTATRNSKQNTSSAKVLKLSHKSLASFFTAVNFTSSSSNSSVCFSEDQKNMAKVMFSGPCVAELFRTLHWGLANSGCFVPTLKYQWSWNPKLSPFGKVFDVCNLVLTLYYQGFPANTELNYRRRGLAFGGKTWIPSISRVNCSFILIGSRPESRAFSYSIFVFYYTLITI